jgi:hypothetical protein
MSIAAEKLAQAQRVRRMARAHQGHVAQVGGDESEAAEDERPHEDFAQLGRLVQQGIVGASGLI